MTPARPAGAVRRIILCGDDLGANEAATAAILQLAASGAISAASCLVHGPCAAAAAASLRAMRPPISIGLHLDLTEFAPAPVRASLRRWLARGFLMRNIDTAQVHEEIRRQMDRFEALFGAAPQFIDGHCHVHQIPGIREPLLDEMLRRYAHRVAVRSTRALRPRGFKGRFIEELGGRSLRALLEQRGVPSNRDFAGAYDLRTASGFDARMQGWLDHLADGGLIMCHPELPAADAAPANAREGEFRFLASNAWAEARRRSNVQLVPFAAG
ncbi:MAG: ChbG/HpnK family deacetylase [Steroidobacteraceae bacterium]